MPFQMLRDLLPGNHMQGTRCCCSRLSQGPFRHVRFMSIILFLELPSRKAQKFPTPSILAPFMPRCRIPRPSGRCSSFDLQGHLVKRSSSCGGEAICT